MYYIKTDKRSQKSAAAMSDALVNLLRTKEFGRITVADIMSSSRTGRATFYRCFDSMHDLLSYTCDRCLEDSFRRRQSDSPNSIREAFFQFSRFLEDNKELVRTVLADGGFETVYQSHIRLLDSIIKTMAFPNDLQQTQLEYMLSLFTGMVMGLTNHWFKRGCSESPEKLYSIVENYLSISLKRMQGTAWE